SAVGSGDKPVLTVASKSFTESFILAEIIAQTAERIGEARVDRKFGMGGTGIVFTSLASGHVDVYPEYSGTLATTVIKDSAVAELPGIRRKLSKMGLITTGKLGFNNTYAIAVRPEIAR